MTKFGSKMRLEGLMFNDEMFLSNFIGFQKHCPAMGRAADLRGVHWHRADHGMGQQGHRDPVGGVRPPRRRLHAQEGAEAQVSVRAQRQGLLQLGQGRLVLSDLLHDSEQAGDGQLVDDT